MSDFSFLGSILVKTKHDKGNDMKHREVITKIDMKFVSYSYPSSLKKSYKDNF